MSLSSSVHDHPSELLTAIVQANSHIPPKAINEVQSDALTPPHSVQFATTELVRRKHSVPLALHIAAFPLFISQTTTAQKNTQ